MKPLVLLRPEPGASLSAARAAAMGIDMVVRMPLFEVRSVDWEGPDPSGFDALLLTSANAVRHAGAGLARYRDLPVHAVGDATAAAASAEGLLVDRVGDGGVDALLAMLPESRRLLHLAGAARRAPADARHAITPVVVYESVARTPGDVLPLVDAVACVHSPRAGERLAEVVDGARLDRARIAIAAISETSADRCGTGWAHLATATSPDDATLLALAKRLCETDPRKDGE